MLASGPDGNPDTVNRVFASVALALFLVGCSPTGSSPAATDGARPSGGDQSASAGSPSAAAAAASTSAEPEGAIAIGDWVAVAVEGLRLRTDAGADAPALGMLPEGVEGLVAAGPIEIDGVPWYALASEGLPDRADCPTPPAESADLSCPQWFGWVAGAGTDGAPWIARAELTCPELPTTILELVETPRGIRLPCFGGQTLTLEAYLSPEGPDRGCATTTITPTFLSGCPVQFLQATETPVQAQGMEMVVTVDEALGACNFGGLGPETCPLAPFAGQWVEVEGTYDHPAAATCSAEAGEGSDLPHPEVVVHHCRELFVVTAVRARD